MDPAIAPASYPLLPTDTFAIEYAKTFLRPFVDPTIGPNTNGFQDCGELDYLKNNVETTLKEVWTKQLSASQRILTVPTRFKSSVSFKAMQRLKMFRAFAMLGTSVPFNQAAGNGTFQIASVQPGETHYVGYYNINQVTIAALGASDWAVVDAAAGAIQISPNVAAGKIGQPAEIDFSYPARTSYQIVAGTKPIIDVDMICRGVSDQGQKGLLRLPRLRITSKGEQDYISNNDDWAGFEFNADALVTSFGGVNACAFWTPLDA